MTKYQLKARTRKERKGFLLSVWTPWPRESIQHAVVCEHMDPELEAALAASAKQHQQVLLARTPSPHI